MFSKTLIDRGQILLSGDEFLLFTYGPVATRHTCSSEIH